MGKEDGNILGKKFGRRTFLKGSAAAAAVACALPLTSLAADFRKGQPDSEGEQVFNVSCRTPCFQACMLNAHVRDGIVRKMSPAAYPEEIYTGGCLRGLMLHQRTYDPNRIKYPMRRVGERGENKWERITWDEAIAEIGEKFGAIRETYGPNSILIDNSGGAIGSIAGSSMASRFSNAISATHLSTCYDQAFGYGTDRVVGGGSFQQASETKGALDSNCIVVWGANPTISCIQDWRVLRRAQENGSKLIVIDPMFSTTARFADEYIYIRPGTDSMLALAMINEIISNELIDIEFAKEKTSAPFLIRKDNGEQLRLSHFRSDSGSEGEIEYEWDLNTGLKVEKKKSAAEDPYLVWDEDRNEALSYLESRNPVIEGEFTVNGIEVVTVYSALKKHVSQYTIEKAEEITQVPAEKIRELSRVFAKQGPIWLYVQFGTNHYYNAHHFGMATAQLMALTGNLATKGASLGGLFLYAGSVPLNAAAVMSGGGDGQANMTIPMAELANLAKTQMNRGKPYPAKGMLTIASNSCSNHAQQNRWFEDVLPNIDFHVVIDLEFNDTVRYADMILPVAFHLEVDDFRVNMSNPYMVLNEKAIEPLYESKPDTEILALIAKALRKGDEYPIRDNKEWIELYLDSDGLREMGVTYERLKEEKVLRVIGSEEKAYINGENGFPTPSGRAELYCEMPKPRLDFGQDWQSLVDTEHFPHWTPPNEAWPENPLFEKYPIVLTQNHPRTRTHTQFADSKTFLEIDPEPILNISRSDAQARGIETGDIVEVFNDRGHVVIKCRINDAFSPGYASINKGWQRHQFIEGGYQELTDNTINPMSVNYNFFDLLVEIRKGG